jgi:riboflavin kinase/FMN adenylyltransferase
MAIFYNIADLPPLHHPVITIGTFDGVHLGHRAILNEVVKHATQAHADSVLITFEPHPRKLLFPTQPLGILTPLQQKVELLSEAGIRHVVVAPFTKAFAALSAADYIKDFLVAHFHPQSIIIGYDHRFGHDRSGSIELLKQYADAYSYNVYEISAQLIDEAAVSSSKIRKELLAGQVQEAAHKLGHYYSITGTVIKGAQLGRTIGYPTANVQPTDPEQLIPANGVYVIRSKWNNHEYKGMLNIGYRPTVSNEHTLHIESHLFDFVENIYDQIIEISFIARLRDEQKFPSLDALKMQLGKDKEGAVKVMEG